VPDLRYAPGAVEDGERLAAFPELNAPFEAAATDALLSEALALLKRHPLIGRPVESGLRDLVISRGRTGYVALYCLDLAEDAVVMLALRHQREVGYRDADLG
jgi:plasmid stabilization system protein ParE